MYLPSCLSTAEEDCIFKCSLKYFRELASRLLISFVSQVVMYFCLLARKTKEKISLRKHVPGDLIDDLVIDLNNLLSIETFADAYVSVRKSETSSVTSFISWVLYL